MKPTDYQTYLDELGQTLRSDAAVTGLILLGSTADPTYRDTFSDHDFWIITNAGKEHRYLEAFNWLPDYGRILLICRHGKSYRAALYQDGHKAEYAVFASLEEATKGKIEKYRVLIDRGGIEELAANVHAQTLLDRAASFESVNKFENFCIVLWSAYQLAMRGEQLSAMRYLNFAIDNFLDLVSSVSSEAAADPLDPRRRIEQRNPELASSLKRILVLSTSDAALELITLAESTLRPLRPNLDWPSLRIIRTWID